MFERRTFQRSEARDDGHRQVSIILKQQKTSPRPNILFAVMVLAAVGASLLTVQHPTDRTSHSLLSNWADAGNVWQKPLTQGVSLINASLDVASSARRSSTVLQNATDHRQNVPLEVRNKVWAFRAESNVRFAEHIRISPRVNASVRILCLVYTAFHRHHRLRSQARTWGPHCSSFLGVSNANDPGIGALKIEHEGPEAYNNMWQKVRGMWKYVHQHCIDNFDFFFVCGDDNFVIVENLEAYLTSDELLAAAGAPSLHALSQIPVLIGGSIKGRSGSINGAGGYVMNRASLRLFVSSMNKTSCSPHASHFAEDRLISACLRANGAKMPRTETGDGLERFSRYDPTFYSKKKRKTGGIGVGCCVQELITLHYLQPSEIYWFYSRLYSSENANITATVTSNVQMDKHRLRKNGVPKVSTAVPC